MKNLKNLGKALNKAEQKEINGGRFSRNRCNNDSDCCHYQHNSSYGYVCYNPSGMGGQCVQGIFFENPCGL